MTSYEGDTIEYKSRYTDAIKFTVVAFANTVGGTLYIGANNDGTICGVNDPDATMLQVTNLLRDAIRPDVTLFVYPEIRKIDGKYVVVINVQSGTSKPYYLHGKGIRPQGVYIRKGSSSVPASESAILEMIKESSGESYEKAVSINQELSFEQAEKFFYGKNVEFGVQQKRTLSIFNQDGIYTNLGLIVSDQNPHTTKIAIFDGDTKTIFRDRRELTGSIFEQLQDALEYLERYNKIRAEFEGYYRKDIRDYPLEAVRKAVLNAMIHRDYGIPGPILISLFDDRLELLNVGGLVSTLTYDDIILGVSVPRNPGLANIFYRLGLIEAYGTGILKINQCYSDITIKPRIEISDHAFKVTLPNVNHIYVTTSEIYSQPDMISDQTGEYNKKQAVLNAREQIVLELLESKTAISRKEVDAALQVSQPISTAVLKDMIQKGVVEVEGKGRSTRYKKK